jgi:hypothetical protein
MRGAICGAQTENGAHFRFSAAIKCSRPLRVTSPATRVSQTFRTLPYTHCPTRTALHALPYTHCPTRTALYALPYTHCPTSTALHALPYTHCPTSTALHALPYKHCPTRTALHDLDRPVDKQAYFTSRYLCLCIAQFRSKLYLDGCHLGCSKHFRNVSKFLPQYPALQPIRKPSSYSTQSESEMPQNRIYWMNSQKKDFLQSGHITWLCYRSVLKQVLEVYTCTRVCTSSDGYLCTDVRGNRACRFDLQLCVAWVMITET